MASVDLRYHGLVAGVADGEGARIQLLTPKGLIREVSLDRRQLIRIIQSAAHALEVTES